MHNRVFFRNFAVSSTDMNHSITNIIKLILIIGVAFLSYSCQRKPQQVRHLGQKQDVDSALIIQLQLNTQLAELADKTCQTAIKTDSTHQYTMDNFGFWYTKTIESYEDIIQEGQTIGIHIQISNLDGKLISDATLQTKINAGDLPIAISRSLKMMRLGEQMRIIAPWYTAYGVEGTSIIKPYSNLLITLTVEQ